MLEGGGGRALLALEDDGKVQGLTELSALTPKNLHAIVTALSSYWFLLVPTGSYWFLLVPTVECGILRHSFLYVRGAAVVLGPCVVVAFLHA